MAAGTKLTIGEYVNVNLEDDKTVASYYDKETNTWTKSEWTINGTLNIDSGKT